MKAMIFLTVIVQPWPTPDFGKLVDSQTLTKIKYNVNGIQAEAFKLYTKAIFGKVILINANFTPKVSSETYHATLCLNFSED
jgi:hypothetical protein